MATSCCTGPPAPEARLVGTDALSASYTHSLPGSPLRSGGADKSGLASGCLSGYDPAMLIPGRVIMGHRLEYLQLFNYLPASSCCLHSFSNSVSHVYIFFYFRSIPKFSVIENNSGNHKKQIARHLPCNPPLTNHLLWFFPSGPPPHGFTYVATPCAHLCVLLCNLVEQCSMRPGCSCV